MQDKNELELKTSLLAAVVLLVISSGSVAQGKLYTAVYSLHNNYSYYCSKKYWHNYGIIGLSSVFAVSLPFIELGRTAGVDSVTLPALNGGLSGAVDIPIGFSLGNSTQTVVYVRGLVQSPCGKSNVIMMLTFYPPPPPLLTSQHFSIDSTLKL